MRNIEKKSVNWLIWSIVFLVFIIVGIFGYLISKQVDKKKKIDSEIDALREESRRIEKENMALEDRISYLGSRDYQEMQAKDKLNLKSPDEKVVYVAEGPVKKKEAAVEYDPESPAAVSNDPNYIKWWYYFFK